jgi:hypothetical protein
MSEDDEDKNLYLKIGRILESFDEMNTLLIDVLKDLPVVDDYLGRLYNYFDNDISKILSHTEGSYVYHKLMIEVISHHEYKIGNYKLNGMNYTLNKEWSDVREKYGETILLPLIEKC